MKDIAVNFIRVKPIDSLPKLHCLFLFPQHPRIKGTRQEFVKRLYVGALLLLEEIIADLQRVGLVDCIREWVQAA